MYYRAGFTLHRFHHGLGKGEAFHVPRCIPLRQEQKGRFRMNAAQTQDGEGTPPTPRGSRSERRQKGRIVPFRVSPAEYEELDALAEQAGLTIGSYVRSRALTLPTTRAIRRPVVEVQVLTRYLAELHKIGSNINQTARRVNMGDTPLATEIAATLAACRRLAEKVKDTLDGNSR